MLTILLPVSLVGAALLNSSGTLLTIAVLVQMLGLIAERWYFFAEANHAQNLYYQAA